MVSTHARRARHRRSLSARSTQLRLGAVGVVSKLIDHWGGKWSLAGIASTSPEPWAWTNRHDGEAVGYGMSRCRIVSLSALTPGARDWCRSSVGDMGSSAYRPLPTSVSPPAASSSVFAAMTKSLRWRPRILWVHHETVTLPHSVRIAG